jgi:hypothetical protein
MNRSIRTICLAACAAAALAASPRAALAREKKPGRFRTTGLVRTVRDDAGNMSAVELHDDRGTTYRIEPDKVGRELAELDGEKVRVTGSVARRDGTAWLTVRGYTDREMIAAHEQWRHMRCNYCAVGPALVNATAPKAPHGAVPIDGRFFPFKQRIAAWAADDRFLWAATDNQVFQIDLTRYRLVRSYNRTDGLPGAGVYGLASDGTTLWIVHRAGVAALAIGRHRIVNVPALACRYACVARAHEGVWVIADTGTFRMKHPGQPAARAPAIPTAGQITKVASRGIWLPHWARKTAHFLFAPTVLGEWLYVASYGDTYELDGGTWRKIAASGVGLMAGADRVWFLDPKGVGEYDPQTKKTTHHVAPAVPKGAGTALLVTEAAVWAAFKPRPEAAGAGGGLARLNLATRKWQTWETIGGRKVDHVAALDAADGALWAACLEGEYRRKPAHPGMTYVKRKVFVTTGLCLHRFDVKSGTWATVPLGLPTFEKRLVIGQDGARGHDVLQPQTVEALSAGPRRVFALTHLFPKTYFCGYSPSVEQLAVRGADGTWAAEFRHRPEELGLQGEQPLVLNISNTGRMVLEAVGHDNVLGLFRHGDTHWTVTEGCVARFDPGAGRWTKVVEPGYRFYWRATAALDEGDHVYVGSDRGLISRLDLATGRFEVLACLDQRSISHFVRDKDGRLLVGSKPSPLGCLPVHLRSRLDARPWTAAAFDGKTWSRVEPQAVPRPIRPPWFVRRVGGRRWKRHRMDKSHGNYLWGPTADGPKPRLYVKGVFYPKFLCAAQDGDRFWVSAYGGLLQVNGVKEALKDK